MDMHKRLKKQWDSNKFATGGKIIDLMHVYTSRAGNLYFVHKNILDLHVVRQIELTKALQRIQFNVDEQFITQWIKGMRSKINTEQVHQMHAHLNDLEVRRKQIPPAQVFLHVALPLIMRHDENPYTWQPNIKDAKLREITNDPDLHSFFLSVGFAESHPYLKEENLKDWKMQNLEGFLKHWTQELVNKATQI